MEFKYCAQLTQFMNCPKILSVWQNYNPVVEENVNTSGGMSNVEYRGHEMPGKGSLSYINMLQT